jgi:hypothetical protein
VVITGSFPEGTKEVLMEASVDCLILNDYLFKDVNGGSNLLITV